MTLDLPFWFKQRQAKADEVAAGTYKVTGPNLPEAYVSVRIGDNLRWLGAVSKDKDGAPLCSTEAEFPGAREALVAAFELYRTTIITG